MYGAPLGVETGIRDGEHFFVTRAHEQERGLRFRFQITVAGRLAPMLAEAKSPSQIVHQYEAGQA